MKHLALRLAWTGTLRQKSCRHIERIRVFSTDIDTCPDCVALRDTWPDLRLCMICGYVGCCDKSKNKHALKHYKETGHPLMRSLGRRGDWMWCYLDQALFPAPRPTAQGESGE